MTVPYDGFHVGLDRLDHGANVLLPAVSEMLLPPAAVLAAHEGVGGPGVVDEAARAQIAYSHFMDTLAARQHRICESLDEIAEALREIVALYRRVDGQG